MRGGGGARSTAELGLVGVAAGWGMTFTLVQDAIRALPPVTFVAYRFLLAAAVLAIPNITGLRRLPRAGWNAAVLLGLFLAGGYLTQTIGLAHTSASNAGFITGLYVVFTPLLGAVVLRQRLTPWAWGCTAAAAFGLFLLSGFGAGPHLLGDTLMLVCALMFAAHILTTDRAVARFAVGPLVAVSLAVCGAVALLSAVVSGQVEAPDGAPVWVALLFTAIVASAGAYVVQSYAQTRTAPARTSLILATEPAFAGLFGYVLAGDRLSAVAWVGATIMGVTILAAEGGDVLARDAERAAETGPG